MDQNSYLAHYGVKGMKWGVRKRRTTSYSKDYSRAEKLSKKSYKSLSNEELQQLNRRRQLEQQYKQLNPSVVQRGIKAAGTLASVIGTVGAIYGVKNAPYVKDGAEFIKNSPYVKNAVDFVTWHLRR